MFVPGPAPGWDLRGEAEYVFTLPMIRTTEHLNQNENQANNHPAVVSQVPLPKLSESLGFPLFCFAEEADEAGKLLATDI